MPAEGIFSIGRETELGAFLEEHGDGDYEFKAQFHEQYGSHSSGITLSFVSVY